MKILIPFYILFLLGSLNTNASPKVSRISDVIYDQREGVALVKDVLVPEKQNGIAIFFMVRGGWSSMNANCISDADYKRFTDRGETVFLVSHGSKPRFKVPEITQQIQRAIQW